MDAGTTRGAAALQVRMGTALRARWGGIAPRAAMRATALRAMVGAAALLLAGCYTVDSVVDAPDANPGDGVCARALTNLELSRGLQAPQLSAAQAELQQQAAALSPAALARVARGDLSSSPDADLAPARATAAVVLRARPATPGNATGIGTGTGAAQRAGGFASATPKLCTLRAAVMEANAHLWKSVVTIPPGTYKLTLPSAPNGAGGSLLITRAMRLQGSGAAATIVDGNATHTVLHVNPAGNADIEINHLTVRNGNAQSGGGLFLQRGKVEMEDLIVSDNQAYSGGAGMVVSEAATAYLRRSTMSNNLATGLSGGAIWNIGTLWVYDSTLNGNQSNRAGAIQNNGTGKLNLRNVTISGNRADVDDIGGASGTGGLHNNGFAVLNNVTITGNTGTKDRAGGLMTIAGATTVLKNSIVAGNITHNPSYGTSHATDCLGPLTGDSKYNLIGISYGCEIPSHVSTFLLDPPAADIKLDPLLASNRGPTKTHRLLNGSVARDAAYPHPQPAADGCENRDQRGVPRPQGSGPCDLGALEYTSADLDITGFMLVDAATNADIRELRNDDWLLLDQLPPQLSIRALVGGAPGSVAFGFDANADHHTENTAPYALNGDVDGDFAAVDLTGGVHTLTATPRALANAGGAAGAGRTIRFNVLSTD